jgi:hypothetical protein
MRLFGKKNNGGDANTTAPDKKEEVLKPVTRDDKGMPCAHFDGGHQYFQAISKFRPQVCCKCGKDARWQYSGVAACDKDDCLLAAASSAKAAATAISY